MRRDLATVIATHELDPDRCDLFVEGPGDRHFLEWLVGDRKHPKASISEIDWVSISVEEGGNRGRLMALADRVPDSVNIAVFVDADFDRLGNRPPPDNVWFTDYRDREGYLQSTRTVEKLWRLALRRSVGSGAVLQSVLSAARAIGHLRISAQNLELDLPFQTTRLHRRVSVMGDMVVLNIEALARALCQSAGVGVQETELLRECERVAALEPQPPEDVIHGKDFLALLAEILATRGVDRKVADRLVWATAERDVLLDHATLAEVIRFLETSTR